MASKPAKYPSDPCGGGSSPDTGAGGSACQPGPNNEPVADSSGRAPGYSPAAQAAVDLARRELHRVGQRGYRVFLVWQERERGGQYRELKRIELMPVRVQGVSDVDWTGDVSGMAREGSLELSEISLAQVSEHDLMGRLDQRDPEDGVEFFYEIVRYARCADDKPEPMRYTPAGLPEYDIADLQWVIQVQDQHNPRGPDGEDRTLANRGRRRRRSSLRT